MNLKTPIVYGYITMTGGIIASIFLLGPISNIFLTNVFNNFLSQENIDTLMVILVIIGFLLSGFLGGIVAKENFPRSTVYTVFTFFVFINILGVVFAINRVNNPPSGLFSGSGWEIVVLIFFFMGSILISGLLALLLFTSSFIGSRIKK